MSYKTDFFRSPHALGGTDTAQPILVALSGGADSCCLLYVLREYSKSVGCKLYAAHVNHNIRTKDYADEAARDEQFCRRLCESLGVELFVLSADVPAIAKQSGEGLETAARRVRYGFLADVMQKTNVKILATAHNADDNLETQIFNLCRGCGADGLCGIPRTRPFNEADGIIVRPILDATKAQILDFCHQNGIEYVTDSTNLEDNCTRNRIRHNVIPELVSLFGTPQRAALRLTTSAEQDADFIKMHAGDFLACTKGKLPLDKLACLHPSVLARVLSLSFGAQYGATLEAVHVRSLARLIEGAKQESSVSLPCRARAVIRQGELIFEKDTRCDTVAATKYDLPLQLGLNFIDGTDFALYVSASDADGGDIPENYQKYAQAVLYCDQNVELSVRNRREGDTIFENGMHKKLKKLMCDKKVGVKDRDTLPLICHRDEMIYAPHCAIADQCKEKKDKEKIKISIYKRHGED